MTGAIYGIMRQRSMSRRTFRKSVIGMVLLGLYPAATFAADFVNGADSRFTYSGGVNGTSFNSIGNLTSSSCPRVDYDPVTLSARGTLVEEQRTNMVPNNTMVGAANGSPGTAPTGWNAPTAPGGLTREIVTSTENGMPVVDMHFFGVSNATATSVFRMNSATSVPASLGQTWATSVFMRYLTAGTPDSLQVRLQELDAGGTTLVQNSSAVLPITTASLRTQRQVMIPTLTGATTAFVAFAFVFALTNGVAYDFWIRVGAPQLELGSFVTTPIYTSTAAVTRTVDTITVAPNAIWYSAATGTIYVEGDFNVLTAAEQMIFNFADSGVNNNLFRASANGTANLHLTATSAGASQWDAATANTFTVGNIPFRAASSYAAADYSAVLNGGVTITRAAGLLPVGENILSLGSDGASGLPMNGHLRKFRYYNSRLVDAKQQGMTR